MASSSLTHGLWFPERYDESSAGAIASTIYRLDATGEVAAVICRAPKTGNIEGIECYVGAVTNALNNGLRAGIQGVDLSTGLNNGSFVQSVTSAANTPAAPGWFNPGTFASVAAVTRGDLIAVVFDNPSFTAGDDIGIGAQSISTDHGFPFGITATSTRQKDTLPLFVLRYDDGSYATVAPEHWPVQQNTNAQFDSADTPDEFGAKITVPWPCTLEAVNGIIRPSTGTAGGSYDVVVYDASDTVLGTISVDTDVAQAVASAFNQYHLFAAPVTLAAGTYRIVVKATSATVNVTVYYGVFASEAIMDAGPGGPHLCATQRVNAGAWTDFDNVTDGFRKPRISLLLNGFDDGTGGGGGGTVYIPQMSGQTGIGRF